MRIALNTQEAFMCMRLLLNTKSPCEWKHIWRVILQRSTCDAHFLIEPLTDCNGFYVICGTSDNYIVLYQSYIDNERRKNLDYFIKKVKKIYPAYGF